MHSAESILGQASLPQDGVCPFSGLWCTHFWATAEVFWQGASTLGTNGCIPTFFYSYNTHTRVFQRYYTKEDGDTAWTSGIVTLSSCFYHITPSSTIWPHSAWCSQPAVSHSFLLPWRCSPSPSIWAATTWPAKPPFLFICQSTFLLFRHESFVLYMAEHKQSQPTPWQNPTTKHTQGWAALELETRWRTAVRANREWESHQEYKNPAIILWFQHLSSGACGLPTTITNVSTQLELHFLIYIQTFADTRIPGTFFVSFYLKVGIQADLCAGLLFPVHLSGLLQLQLLLLVLFLQTLLLWQ